MDLHSYTGLCIVRTYVHLYGFTFIYWPMYCTYVHLYGFTFIYWPIYCMYICRFSFIYCPMYCMYIFTFIYWPMYIHVCAFVGDFSSSFRSPCVVFTGHPSLRCGPAVHLMEAWRSSSKNAVFITEPGLDHCNVLLPYQPLTMKVHTYVRTFSTYVSLHALILTYFLCLCILLPVSMYLTSCVYASYFLCLYIIVLPSCICVSYSVLQ